MLKGFKSVSFFCLKFHIETWFTSWSCSKVCKERRVWLVWMSGFAIAMVNIAKFNILQRRRGQREREGGAKELNTLTRNISACIHFTLSISKMIFPFVFFSIGSLLLCSVSHFVRCHITCYFQLIQMERQINTFQTYWSNTNECAAKQLSHCILHCIALFSLLWFRSILPTHTLQRKHGHCLCSK